MKNNVQARLRAASHPCHVRINHHPLLVGLTGSDYPEASYRTVLVAYFHLYEMLEQRISQFIEQHGVAFDYSSRVKLPWLQADLDFLHEDPRAASNRPAAQIEFPAISSVGQLIGVLYPLEGASLGGQVVAQHLQKNRGYTLNAGARFFNAYGENTAARWQEFCQFADTIQLDEEQCQFAEATALLTFNTFEKVLNEAHQPVA